MNDIDILQCVLEDGSVRRPYPGEPTQFNGAYRQDSEGHSQHIVDFYCMDLGFGYHNNRYMVIFGVENEGPYHFVSLTPFGTLTRTGEMQTSDLGAVLAGKGRTIAVYHFVPYGYLPEPVQRQIQHECRQYVSQPETA